MRLEPGVAVVVGPERLGQVERRRRDRLGRRARWRRRELRAEKPDDVLFAGCGGAAGRGLLRGRAPLRQPGRRGAARVLGALGRAASAPRRRGPVPRSTARPSGASTSSSCSPTSGSAAGCTRSSARAASRRSSARSRRSGARCSRRRPGSAASSARKHRAELKLARVAIQVERARDVEAEVKKRLRPLALQATAAERAEKLRGEIASLRARIAELDLARAARERREDRRGAAHRGGARAQHADETARGAARGAPARRGGARRRGGPSRGGDRDALPAAQRARAARAAPRERARRSLERLRRGARRSRGACLDARVRAERESAARAGDGCARERLAALERALAEREGLPPRRARSPRRASGSRCRCSTSSPGTSAPSLRRSDIGPSALVAGDATAALALAERARAAGLGSVVVLTRRARASSCAELPVVPKEELLYVRRSRP